MSMKPQSQSKRKRKNGKTLSETWRRSRLTLLKVFLYCFFSKSSTKAIDKREEKVRILEQGPDLTWFSVAELYSYLQVVGGALARFPRTTGQNELPCGIEERAWKDTNFLMYLFFFLILVSFHLKSSPLKRIFTFSAESSFHVHHVTHIAW